jgi:hypothetical protein
MTVSQLIDELRKMPQEATAYTPDLEDRFPQPGEINSVDYWDDPLNPGVYLL